MLKLNDLKKQGLQLTQLEAQEIHHRINGVSQGHNQDGIIFPASTEQPKADPLKGYYEELRNKNAELVKRVSDLEDAANSTVDNYEYQAKIEELEKHCSELTAKNTDQSIELALLKNGKVLVVGENTNGQTSDDYTIDDDKKVNGDDSDSGIDGDNSNNNDQQQSNDKPAKGKPGRKPKAN